MIFKILLLLAAALFVTVQATPKPIHNPGCKCGPTTYIPKWVSGVMNRAIIAGGKVDTTLSVGPPVPYPKKFENKKGLVYELCTGVAPEHMYEYPLSKTWKPGKKIGKYFVIYDARTNKFCGCFTRENGGEKCLLLGNGDAQGKGKGGESSNPVPNPVVVPP